MPEREDWAVLGIAPGAAMEEIDRAYRRRMELYRVDALATYSLLSDEERAEIIARVERAYHSIVGANTETVSQPKGSGDADVGTGPPTSLPPDPLLLPGAYLRHRREALGLSLAQVTARTKIRTPILDALENEDFTALPAEVYVRGFVIQVGKVLNLPDPHSLAEHYLARLNAARD